MLITGPSGFGKSTLSEIISGERPATVAHLDEYAERMGDSWMVDVDKLWRRVIAKNHEFLIVEGVCDNITEVMSAIDAEEIWVPVPPIDVYRRACRDKAIAYMEDNNVSDDDSWVRYWLYEARRGDTLYKMYAFVEWTGFVGTCNVILLGRLRRSRKAWSEYN
jgi:adenylate kinase family enzyme